MPLLQSSFNHMIFNDIRIEEFFAKAQQAEASHRTHVNYNSKTMLLNESGLYSLILSSKLPQTRECKRWVASEVLGQIRKMGGYIPINGCDLVLWFYSSIIFKHTPIQNEK